MSNIDKQALLVSKAKASVFTMGYISQFEASDIDSDDIDLRFEVDGVETGTTVSIVDECGHAAQIITALLDELEHYKSREERVTKLVLDNSTSWDVLYEKLEAAEKRIAEQREYYEGVIADGSKRIAELEKGHQEAAKQINSWRRLAKQNIAERGKDISELEAARQRIAEFERSETQLISERDDAESALNDAYKAVMGQAPEWSNWFSFENAIDEIELACELWRNQTDDVIQFRQRIAELEARAVNLPKRSVGEVMHLSGFSRDYAEGWCAGNDNAMHEIRAAGIKVKGE